MNDLLHLSPSPQCHTDHLAHWSTHLPFAGNDKSNPGGARGPEPKSRGAMRDNGAPSSDSDGSHRGAHRGRVVVPRLSLALLALASTCAVYFVLRDGPAGPNAAAPVASRDVAASPPDGAARSLLTSVAMDPKTVRLRVPPAYDASPPAPAEYDVTPVFYNAFAASMEDVPHVLSIVAEQFALLRPGHEVRFRSIGTPVASEVSGLPNPSDRPIKFVAHDDAGDEVGTLRLLWEHCVAHPDGAAVYLHSKGSFHPSSENDDLRRFLTRGALSEACAAAVTDGGGGEGTTCDVCASRFSPVPHPHAPGNMWIARCDHVRRLRDPSHFALDMEMVPSHGTDSCAGRKRFAAEHWVHSHPRTRPCDLYMGEGYTSGYDGIPRGGGGEWAMDVRPAPRFDRSVFVLSKKCRKQHAGELEDRLMEYEALYGEEPSDEWWGWKFFGAMKMEQGDVTLR